MLSDYKDSQLSLNNNQKKINKFPDLLKDDELNYDQMQNNEINKREFEQCCNNIKAYFEDMNVEMLKNELSKLNHFLFIYSDKVLNHINNSYTNDIPQILMQLINLGDQAQFDLRKLVYDAIFILCKYEYYKDLFMNLGIYANFVNALNNNDYLNLLYLLKIFVWIAWKNENIVDYILENLPINAFLDLIVHFPQNYQSDIEFTLKEYSLLFVFILSFHENGKYSLQFFQFSKYIIETQKYNFSNLEKYILWILKNICAFRRNNVKTINRNILELIAQEKKFKDWINDGLSSKDKEKICPSMKIIDYFVNENINCYKDFDYLTIFYLIVWNDVNISRKAIRFATKYACQASIQGIFPLINILEVLNGAYEKFGFSILLDLLKLLQVIVQNANINLILQMITNHITHFIVPFLSSDNDEIIILTLKIMIVLLKNEPTYDSHGNDIVMKEIQGDFDWLNTLNYGNQQIHDLSSIFINLYEKREEHHAKNSQNN